MRSIGRDPIFIERAAGAEIIDVDGNLYVDYVCSWGPLIHGHAHPAVLEAIAEAAALGTTFGAADGRRGRAGRARRRSGCRRRHAADDLVGHRGGDERDPPRARRDRPRQAAEVRRRLPRPRRRAARRGGLRARHRRASPPRPGVPEAATAATVVVPWNDPDAVARRVRRARVRRGAVRALPGQHGPRPAGHAASSSCCASCATEHGALLVFDEVITGFRVSPGGAQELCGVLPDLTVMGKVIGGGLPAAAYGGSVELMELVAPAGDVYQAGTLSGNPLAVAAGPRRARAARRGGLPQPVGHDAGAGRRPARGGRRPARPGRAHDRPADRLLLRAAGARLRGRRRVRHRGLRRLVPRAAGPRRLPAAVAVRGLVPVAGPHARARDADARGRRRGVRRDRSDDALDATSPARAARRRAACSPTRSRDRRPARDAARRAAAAGARAAGREADYALLVEAIREGYLQHYGEGRVVRTADPDLALLAGDRLYALGLARLAELGDLDAVAELADVISLCAQAHAEGDPERAAAVWEAGAAAVGRGTTHDHEAAKAAWRGAPTPPRPGLTPAGRYCSRPSRVRNSCPCLIPARRPSPSTPPTGRSRAPSRARPSRAGAS